VLISAEGTYIVWYRRGFSIDGATFWVFSQMGKPKELIGGANYNPFDINSNHFSSPDHQESSETKFHDAFTREMARNP
jgi:hypothetical protein